MSDWGSLYSQALLLVKKESPDREINKELKEMAEWSSRKLKQFIDKKELKA